MQSTSRAVSLGVAAVFTVLSATSCDTPIANEANPVGQVVLTPTSATLQAGTSVILSALVLDAAGNEMRDRRVVWASENEAIATVSPAGVVIGVATGAVQIAASSGGKSARASISVTRRPVSLVRISPASATIAVTGSVALQAAALDAAGDVVHGRPIAWSTSNETIASVNANGVVVGVAAGSVTITATIDGRDGMAGVSVAPQPVASVVVAPTADTVVLGGRVAFRATAVDEQNVPLADRIVLWSSNNATVATVSSDGEVFGLALGSARIRATVEGKFADATILVQQVPVAHVAVTPNDLTLTSGQTSQLSVMLSDSAGNAIAGRSVAYATSDAQIASVSATGLITAIAQGSAQIQVSSEGQTANAAVTVNPVPIAAIAITPNVVTLRLAQVTRLVAQAFDARGAPLANRTFTWSSSTPSAVSVNQSGDVTGVALGTASISASSEGQVGSATVSVPVTPVAAIAISPKPVLLLPSQQIQLGVQLLDSAGGLLGQAGRPVTWLSRNAAIATVTSTGQLAGVAPGNTRIVASTAAGTRAVVFDSADVTVASPPVSAITVQPQTQTMQVGDTRALRALIANGGAIARGRNVSWLSRAASIVSVTPVAGWPDSAAVLGVSLGTAYVVATEPGGLRDSSLIIVNPVAVASVLVTPPTASLAVNATVQLSAAPKDSAGNTLVRTITWVSRSPSVVSVSATGFVTANAAGSTTIEARANGAGANGADVVGTAPVTVTTSAQTQAPVHSVIVTSPRSFIVPRDTMHLTVVLRDAQNNVLTGRRITFSSSSTSRMTVSAAGVVTGVASSGNSDITATSEGKSNKLQLDSESAVASIRVSGPTNSAADLLIQRGAKKRYTVTVENSGGNGIGGVVIAITNSSPNLLSLSNASVTTSGSGRATVDISAGTAAGPALITFTAVRAGAIPPSTPGKNSPAAGIPIVVP